MANCNFIHRPIKLKVISNWCEAQEHVRECAMIGFTSDRMNKWREFFFNQSQSVVLQNQNLITFDTQIKTALSTSKVRGYYLAARRYDIRNFSSSVENVLTRQRSEQMIFSCVKIKSHFHEYIIVYKQTFLAFHWVSF